MLILLTLLLLSLNFKKALTLHPVALLFAEKFIVNYGVDGMGPYVGAQMIS